MIPAIILSTILKVAGPIVADKVSDMIRKDPVAKNELNAEKPHQSRVVVGASGSLIMAVGVVLTQVGGHDFPSYDWAVLGPALGILFSSAYALYGRLKTGLKPLWE